MKGLYIVFPNGTVNTDYILSSLTKNENYFKSLKSVDNNCKLNAVFSIDLANKLKQFADVNLPASVYDEEENLIFSGYLRKTFSFVKTQRNQPIAIEIVSPSFILDKQLQKNIFQTNSSLGSIINKLGEDADFNLECTLTETVDYFFAKKGDNIKETIENLLFEFGYTFDFNNLGNFVIYDLFDEPTNNITHEFTGSDCLEQIQIRKTEKEYTGVTASWNRKEFVENTLLYEDTTGNTSSLACSIEVPPYSYMYGDDNTEGKHHLEYDSTRGEVLRCTRITPSIMGPYTEQLETSYENNGDSVLWSAYNPSGVITAVFNKFQWFGDAWISTSKNESKTTVTGDKSLELNIKYLNSNEAVANFITKVADYYRYSLFNITLKSKVDVEIGSFVTVEDYGIGKITGRVIAKKTTYSAAYNYTIESISEYEPAELDEQKNYVSRLPSDGSASNIAEVSFDLSRIYSNHIVTLYKESSTFISESGITSNAVYNFSDNGFSFIDPNGANGWSYEKPENPTYTLYTITATAIGKTTTDEIAFNEWSSPIPIGQNGVSTRTIQLFKRSDAQPSDLPKEFTQDFFHTSIDATMQQLNEWNTSYPSVEETTLPVWEIHVTVTSASKTVLIQPSMWSLPIKIAQDMEITQAEIQEMVNKAQKLSAPTVYADTSFGSIMVDEDNIALSTQTVSTTIHVLQLDEELEFNFGKIVVPNGFTVTHNRNVLTITVAEGTLVKSCSLVIPVLYFPYISMDKYGDETEEVYTDENGDEYGCYIYSDVPIIYNFGFGIAQTKSGRYLHSISDVASIPQELFIGDFFTWNGINTESTLCEEGIFKQGAVYKWNGAKWKKDTSPNHLQTALSDVLTNANVDLQNNNSEVFGMFQKILSNEAILENLIVTGSALINRLNALNIYADKFTSYDEKAKGYADNSEQNAKTYADGVGENAKNDIYDETGLNNLTDKTIIEGSKIKTGLINADAIRTGLAEVNTLTSGGYNLDAYKFASQEVTSALNDKIDEVNTSIPQSRLIVEEVRECYYKTREKDITKIPQGDVYRNIDIVDEWTWYNVQIEDGYYIYARTKKKYYDGHSEFSDIYVHSKTIINGGFIRTGLIETDKIKIGTNNLDSTIIEDGKIKTGLINADEITTGYASIDYLKSGNAEFNGFVKANYFGLVFEVGENSIIDIGVSNDRVVRPQSYFVFCGSGKVKIKLNINVSSFIDEPANVKLKLNEIVVFERQYTTQTVITEEVIIDVTEEDKLSLSLEGGSSRVGGTIVSANVCVKQINYLTKKLLELSKVIVQE